MSIQHGNRGIVKKDLQLYYNREYNGSFLGEATMNFFTIPTLVDAWGSHTSVRTSTSSGVPDLIVSGNKQVYYTPEYYTLTATSAWQAEVHRWLVYPKQGSGANSYVPNGTYNFSFYARSLSGNTVLQYSFYGITPRSTATLTTKWQRFNGTFTINNGPLTLLEFGNLNAGSMVCQIACIQVEAKSYATPFTVPVLWTPNLVNVTSTNGHTTFVKNIGSSNWGDSSVYSTEGYSEPCYVSFKASQISSPIMVGLNSDPTTDSGYGSIDYCWYVTWDSGNPSYIFQNGTNVFTAGVYTTATLFEIIYDGVNVKYYMDGVLKYTSLVSPTLPLYLDSSFYSNAGGGTINSLSFGKLSQINRFSNYVIGGGGLKDISGNNNNIDLTSSAVAFDNGGYYFNANAQGAITTPVANSILDNLSNNSHTYECWFKLLGTPPGLYSGYFFGRQGYHSGFYHGKSNPNVIEATTWYNDVTNTGLGATLSLNIWYHGVFITDVENAMRYLYINGVLRDSATLTKQLRQYASTTPYYIGAASTDYASNSIVSSARAYNKPLSVAEVLQNFNATRTTYGI